MVYLAGIEGQFGEEGSSVGISRLVAWARHAGIMADYFYFQDIKAVENAIRAHNRIGYDCAIVCYSAGVGTGDYVSELLTVKLLVAIDPSRDCINYKVNPKTEHSILIHNNYWLTHITGVGGAGEAQDPWGDLGFKTKYEFNEEHLLIDLDWRVQKIAQDALLALKGGVN